MEKRPSGRRGIVTLSPAMGWVSVQADCTVDETLNFIVDRAQLIGCIAYEIAFAVVAGIVRFDL